MTKFLLIVDYNSGVIETPMDEWSPEDVKAHMDYYIRLNDELRQSGELVGGESLTGPELAKSVTSDGISAPVVTDGPFLESKELLAGFQVIDVESEERAIEIAALVSAVPGPGGVPSQQPIGVRRVMDEADFQELNPLG
ncbi:YCII-related protein [Kribbella flavida DSM 17836]|uniref:YCII-related protein n=1 Tax=Kribbella flavida (strain DSM 17836 / JCM 10339 / NBRC 14399) TaxID=479435 RepID=D2Q269_KRIFD|nr:YciI family protein [Kribbella flavida]ADB34015.1 YCII-related protein [Kribbella flavida DSM 17836]